ncbi:hypothetical protein BDN72DRAFT_846027 [Pluteus cervinus]|uniref:Uncharacterized protein n=1 Tax=Pluteus cervinus TaxID=181527 RepID=A0ACD3AH60_9AGAR|nr:hypothetical protein BDN72DRAFT_846027 [Pluteus cervinus]
MAPSKPSDLLRQHLGLSDNDKEMRWERLAEFVENAVKSMMKTSASSPAAKSQVAALYQTVQHVLKDYKPRSMFPMDRRIPDTRMVEDYIIYRVNLLRRADRKKIRRETRRPPPEQGDSASDGEEDDPPPFSYTHSKKQKEATGYIDLADDSDDPMFVPFTPNAPITRGTTSTAIQRTNPPESPSYQIHHETPIRTVTPEPPPAEQDYRRTFRASSPDNDGDMDIDVDDINRNVERPRPPFNFPSGLRPVVVVRRPTNFAARPAPAPAPAPAPPPLSVTPQEPRHVQDPPPLQPEVSAQGADLPPHERVVDELYNFLSLTCRPSLAHLYSHLASHGYIMDHLVIMSKWDRPAIRAFLLGVQESVDKWGDENVRPIHWDVLEHYIRELRLMHNENGGL